MSPDYDAANLAAHPGGIAPAQSSPSPLANIFKGPNGIRAGWRLLLFVVFWLATMLAMQFVLLHIPSAAAWLRAQDPHAMTPSSAIFGEALMVSALLVATLLTLVFLPALYVAWFRIKPPRVEAEAPALIHGN